MLSDGELRFEISKLISAGRGIPTPIEQRIEDVLALIREQRKAAANRARRACARLAAAEGKRLCGDVDSIQYQLGKRIAELILEEVQP
jgi:hypothetical protein